MWSISLIIVIAMHAKRERLFPQPSDWYKMVCASLMLRDDGQTCGAVRGQQHAPHQGHAESWFCFQVGIARGALWGACMRVLPDPRTISRPISHLTRCPNKQVGTGFVPLRECSSPNREHVAFRHHHARTNVGVQM